MAKMWITMGPQHPMTHGLWTLRVQVDGETVVDAEAELGYIHRGVEKIAEARDFTQVTPYCDRLCYVSAMTWSNSYIYAAEDLLEVEVPERAEYIRCISAECQRIASHLMWLGAYGPDVGNLTIMTWALREREMFLDLLQELGGSRMHYNYPRIGGVKRDISSALTRGINSKRLCNRLKKKDGQMCELKYDKKFDPKAADWKKLRVKELRKICDDEGIDTIGLVEKDEYVKKIKAHFNIKDEV